MTPTEHDATKPSAGIGRSAVLSSLLRAHGAGAPSRGSRDRAIRAPRGLIATTLALLSASLLLAISATPALAKQARLFAGTFGAASNPAPFPANPYPLSAAEFLAVDESSHDVYVTDAANHRVEKFDASGNFLFMLGREVNKTAVEATRPEAEQNVCPAPGHPADVCQPGQRGSTPGTFEEPAFLAVDNSSGESKGDLYVADKGHTVDEQQTITVNATGGTFTLTFEGQTTIPIAFNAPVNRIEGAGSLQAALESTAIGTNYAAAGSTPGNYKLTFVDRLGGQNLPQITANSSGLTGGTATATVATLVQGSSTARIEKFDPAGHPVTAWAEGGQFDGSSVTSPPATVAGPFVELAGIAVDPAGHLWVAASYTREFEFGPEAGLINDRKGPSLELAVDSEGNAYFIEGLGLVTKFNSAGTPTGVVTPTKEEYEHNGFSEGHNFAARGIAVDGPSGDLYVAGEEEPVPLEKEEYLVKRYDSSCQPADTHEEPEPGCAAVESFGAGLISGRPHSIAIDSSTTSLYVSEENQIAVFAARIVPDALTSKPTDTTAGSTTLTGTIDPSGVELDPGSEGCRFEWGETTAYGQVAPCDETAAEIGTGNSPVAVHAGITGLQAGKTYHYRLVAGNANDVNGVIDEPSYGSDLSLGPPLIEGSSALSVVATAATLQAEVDPQDLDAHMRLEYGPEGGAYDATEPIDVGSAGSSEAITVQLQDLIPGAVYHYRVVAENVLGAGAETGEEAAHTFTTETPGGFSLPDGRVWELVSPVDKHAALIEPITETESAIQASTTGDAFTYAVTAPTESQPEGNLELTQALSTREPASGSLWASRDISSPHEVANGCSCSPGDPQGYRFFSPDLSSSILEPIGAFDPSISPEASGQTTFLRTDFPPDAPGAQCQSSCFRPLVTDAAGYANEPEGTEVGGAFLGASPDGSHIVLSLGEHGLYEWAAGVLQPVSVLPNGEPLPPQEGPSLGYKSTGSDNLGTVRNAISEDGSRVVWSTSGHSALYMRDMVSEETVLISEGSSQAPDMFQTANSDDSRVFYTIAGDLYEFEAPPGEALSAGHVTNITPGGGVLGLVPGASEDGSSLYFVADTVLSGTEANGENEAAVAGRPNLYLDQEGTIRLVAVLSKDDEHDWDSEIAWEFPYLSELTARVSPNGRWLAFMSDRPLTGYDNRDAASGERDEEVFLYDANADGGKGGLICASCDPTGARPHGKLFKEEGIKKLLVDGQRLWGGGNGVGDGEERWVAANVPGWTTRSHQSRYLSDEGRLFFDSDDALVPADTNDAEDVYEFEPPGVGSCSGTSATYSVRSGGCVDLVSSGTSKEESAFMDASESGDDAFFLTSAQLSKQDLDSVDDVYDARVDGVAFEPQAPPACEGDACQSPVAPPTDLTPASLTYQGPGNLLVPAPTLAAATKKLAVKCAKGKKLVHGKCVRKKAKKTKSKQKQRSKNGKAGDKRRNQS